MVFQAGRDMYVRLDAASRSTAVVLPVVPLQDAVQPLFIGRGGEQQQLESLFSSSSESTAIVVSGLAGVGKTALSWHAAARAVERGLFPGGAVMVNLHGYEPELALEAAQVFGPLLRALGQSPADIPARAGEQAAAYHHLLAQRAAGNEPVLLILDNASKAGQITDLLPVSATHRVVVTSRDLLAPRIRGARSVRLTALPPAQAAELLAASVIRHTADKVMPAHQESISALAALCGNLPLALEIVSALLAEAADPGQLVEDLADTHTRLSFLDDGERAVRAAFDLSFVRLNGDEATCFTFLSLNPGPELATDAAAVLFDRPQLQTRRALSALRRAHLLEPGTTSDRWSMHDLLRLYAAEVLAQRETAQTRDEALERILRHYSARVRTEERCFYPPQQTGAVHDERWVTRRQQAIDWFDIELPNLVGAVSRAAAMGFADLSVRTAAHLFHYFDHYRLWPEWEATHRAALVAARQSGDEVGQAQLLCSLGLLLREQHRTEEARQAQSESLELARRTCDTVREGWAAVHLGGVLHDMRRYEDAATILGEAVSVFAGLGDAHGEAWAHQNLGSVHAALGRTNDAIIAYEGSIRVRAEAGDSYGAVFTWTQLGAAYAAAGQLEQAGDCLQRSMDLCRHLGYDDELALAQGLMSSVCTFMKRSEEADEHRNASFASIRAVSDLHKSVIAFSELAAQQAAVGDTSGAGFSYREALDLLGVEEDPQRSLSDQVADEIHRAEIRTTSAT
ncbi:tetratricopeptide repeat protein [Streptomyces chartreusis]|uniref:tetratricopeptide repeat protein n=1 Tax=Streptomyces chartreusis TaxID=1969 RepID=UPI00123DC4A0|nr:tetratricopeptide repeat protein [Streptomyces chartreusis]QEV69348.1 ATP-binding protein [Streptomyces chartreusis]GGX18567.1 hypothetical protein GCM10010321_36450 [Streptomyces chartreusis]